MNLNKVFLIGRLTADPESRTTPSGQQVTTVRIATNRVWNDRQTGQKQEATEFHSVVAWGGLADIVNKYLRKGQLAFFEGRLQTRSWQGNDGVKRYRTEVVAENMQLGPKAAGYEVPAARSAPPEKDEVPAFAEATAGKKASAGEEEIPIIEEGAPLTSPVGKEEGSSEETAEIDLKDIPF